MESAPLRAWLVDDEPLAIERLTRMLSTFNSIQVAGSSTDAAQALEFLDGESTESAESIDVLFLDIQMPGITGFDLLARLVHQPLVIFTTAYDEYALRAFEVNSIDYLVKPIEPAQLERAVNKLGRLRLSLSPAGSEVPTCPACFKSLPKPFELSVLTSLAVSLRALASESPSLILTLSHT